MAEAKSPSPSFPSMTEKEWAIVRSSLSMKIASLDRASKGYPVGSAMWFAVREDIQAVRLINEKIGGL